MNAMNIRLFSFLNLGTLAPVWLVKLAPMRSAVKRRGF